MTDVKKANPWTNQQLKKLLKTEHIRQHLLKVGLINRYGEVVPKEEYEHLHKRQSRRRRRPSSKPIDDKPASIHRPLTAMHTKHRTESTKNFKQHGQSNHLTDRKYKNTSNFPSRQANKSSSPTRLSSPNQSTRGKSLSAQHTVSPKVIPANNRCVITMIYYGPQKPTDWFQSEGDEIVVMQQHCGGENLIVHKGALKPNETFQFESRRHSDYPFALAFYVNGLIDNRLSVCCESRYTHNVRISGKRGLFGIINVQKSKACRRCRHEQRKKRLAELKAKKNLPIRQEISTPEPNITHSTSPELTISPQERSELQRTDLSNAHSADINVPGEHIHSFASTSHENGIPTSEKHPNHQRRASTGKENNDQTRAMINRSNKDLERTSTEINRKDIDE